MSKSHGGKIGEPFVYLFLSMMDCPAWRALSHGAKSLYTELKRGVYRGRNTAYLSYRVAGKKLRASSHKIAEWFAELEHYGFIVLAAPGCLGVDGKGKAPHWRLTERGTTSKTSANGVPDIPTRDYLKWDGVLFDPKPFRRVTQWNPDKLKKQNPVAHVSNTPLLTSATPPLLTSATPKRESVADGVDIQSQSTVAHVVDISSLTTTGDSEALTSADLGRLRNVRSLSNGSKNASKSSVPSSATGGASWVNGRKGKIGT
jgi:hypothetical protein